MSRYTDTMDNIKIATGIARATTTGVEHGVCFTLTLDGDEHEGQVTLLPHEDGRPGYGRWGDRDHWLDGAMVALLRGRDDAHDILDAIESATAPVARRFAREAA